MFEKPNILWMDKPNFPNGIPIDLESLTNSKQTIFILSSEQIPIDVFLCESS